MTTHAHQAFAWGALLVALCAGAASLVLLPEAGQEIGPAPRPHAGQPLQPPPPAAPPAPAGTAAEAAPALRAAADRAPLSTPELEPAALRVRVRGQAGAPLAEARVALRGPGGDEVQGRVCDERGRCIFARPPSGPLELVALAEGHLVPAPVRLPAIPAEEVVLDLVPGSELTLVIEREDGAPLGAAGAEVELLAPPGAYLAPDAPLRTDPQGRITLRGLPSGSGGQLVARAAGCASARLTLPELPAVLPQRLVLPVLRLTVWLENLGAAPGPGLTLELRGPAAGGAAQRLPFPGAELSPPLTGEGEGWARLVQRDAASPWRRFEVSSARPHARVRLGLGGPAPLGGLVVDPEGEPLPDVQVSATDAAGASRSTRTGPDGRFRLEAHAGEEWRVEASRPGCTPASAECLAPEELLVLVLTPAVRVIPRPFLGAHGQPLRGVLSFEPGAPDPHAEQAGPAGFLAELDAEGRVELREVPAGAWTISLFEPADDELRAWVLEATLEPGSELPLGPSEGASERHALAGRVLGAPPGGGVQVELRPAHTEEPSQTFSFIAARPAGEDGSFAFSAVPAGRYRLRALWEGGGSQEREVEVPFTRQVELSAE